MSLLVFCLLAVLQGLSAKHSDDCPHIGDCPQVDAVVDNVDLNFSDRLCHDLKDISCNAHHASHDEQICGTDGVTYIDHCHYVQAKCEAIHSNSALDVAFHGACPEFTIMPSTAKPIVTTQPAPIESTAAPVPTSTPSASQILGNVFCQQINYISCLDDLQVVCASNGQFFPNKCELAKAQCGDPTLTEMDLSSCSPPV